jgi:antitoxin CcdA
MRTGPKNVEGHKVPTNLSLRADVVQRAKALGVNLSATVEAALEKAVAAAERRAWLDVNREAITEYNALVEQRGVFSDDWRKF